MVTPITVSSVKGVPINKGILQIKPCISKVQQSKFSNVSIVVDVLIDNKNGCFQGEIGNPFVAACKARENTVKVVPEFDF